jgi:hypothetical protein
VPNLQIDSLYDIMRKQTLPIESPAGTFDSDYHFDRTFYLDTAAIPEPNYHIRHDKEYYVENIGVVRYTSFYASPTDLEMRLVRYKVKQ